MLLSLLVLLIAAPSALALDPADSWLVYAKASGGGKKVLSVTSTWKVPAYPTTRGGGNAPGWWFGIEPVPADVLIQPILAYGDGVPEYQIFTGYYNWHDGDWEQSKVDNVKPGQEVVGTVTLDPSTGLYTQSIKVAGGKPISTVVTKAQANGEVFTDVYFVVEHQPNSCSEYPADGKILFENIAIEWEGSPSKVPAWNVSQFKPACNSRGSVVNSSSLLFTWDTK
jgi:hypothetical protein